MEKQSFESGEKAEGCFKPKDGSVFPVKRKSVKRLMCGRIARCVCNNCLKMRASDSKKGNSVHPTSSLG